MLKKSLLQFTIRVNGIGNTCFSRRRPHQWCQVDGKKFAKTHMIGAAMKTPSVVINYVMCSVVMLMWFMILPQIVQSQSSDPPANDPVLRAHGFLSHHKSIPGVDGRSGAYGANRVILSPTGFGAARGTFYMPDELSLGRFFVPDSIDKLGKRVIGRNPNQDKPTFYFGAVGSNFAIDAGVQYEGNFIAGAEPGWSQVMYVSVWQVPTDPYGCWHWYQTPGRLNRRAQQKATAIDTSISIDINGPIHLKMSGFPDLVDASRSHFSPNLYPNATRPIETAKLQIKRIIGMTQKEGTVPAFDGAYMHNVRFTNGHITPWNNDGTLGQEIFWSSGTNHYVPDGVNQGLTHPYGNYLAGTDLVGTPIYILDSAGYWRRTYNPPYGKPDSPIDLDAAGNPKVQHSRYFEEAVDVDLLSAPGQIAKKPKQTGKNH